jgi:hypothetical protein
MGIEAVDHALAHLLLEDGIRGNAFFFDEFFDLTTVGMCSGIQLEGARVIITRSRVFFARSLTKGRAMTGIL